MVYYYYPMRKNALYSMKFWCLVTHTHTHKKRNHIYTKSGLRRCDHRLHTIPDNYTSKTVVPSTYKQITLSSALRLHTGSIRLQTRILIESSEWPFSFTETHISNYYITHTLARKCMIIGLIQVFTIIIITILYIPR